MLWFSRVLRVPLPALHVLVSVPSAFGRLRQLAPPSAPGENRWVVLNQVAAPDDDSLEVPREYPFELCAGNRAVSQPKRYSGVPRATPMGPPRRQGHGAR